MAGDYWRYLAEFAVDEDRTYKANEACKKYEEATKAAIETNLPPTNPIRLGLALNFSVFYYEILNDPAVRIFMNFSLASRTSLSSNMSFYFAESLQLGQGCF